MKQYIALLWVLLSMLAGETASQSRNNRLPQKEQSTPIGVKRTITSYVPDAGTMSLTYQKKRINGLLSFEGEIILNSLEYFNDDNFEIRLAIEWGLENEFYKDRSQRLAFYGRVGDGSFSTWKIVNPFTGTYKALDDYRWFCSLSQDDPDYIDQEGILTLIEIKDSVIDKASRDIKLTFTFPIKRGYFNVPEQAVYRLALNWGIFPSRESSDINRVRGLAAPARTWSLEYMALPESFMREDETVTYRPKTFVFIIGKSQPFGPLFPDPYFMEELEFAIIAMYFFSVITYFGIPGFLTIAFFISVYNVWSIAYAGWQLLTVDNTDPLQRKYFTLQNFIYGPVRQLIVNILLFYFVLGANTFPIVNLLLEAIFVGLIYINMIVVGPDGIDLDDSN